MRASTSSRHTAADIPSRTTSSTGFWRPIVEEGRTSLRPVLATIPSETQYSRASLLAGRLVTGGTDEASAFAAHSGLVGVSTANRPPRLYAKGDIPGNTLPAAVRDEIASPTRRVVGSALSSEGINTAMGTTISCGFTPPW